MKKLDDTPMPTAAHTKGACPSPCVRNCCLDDKDVCLGCGRSLDEIRRWSLVDEGERWHILERANARLRERPAFYSLYKQS